MTDVHAIYPNSKSSAPLSICALVTVLSLNALLILQIGQVNHSTNAQIKFRYAIFEIVLCL